MHWVLLALVVFDLASVQSEPNLEKRSDLALKNADAAVTLAREAYKAGDAAQAKTSLEEVRESVRLSFDSLEATGKNPRGSGSYKRAELATRQLLRRLTGLRDTMSVVDQDWIDPVRTQVNEIHDKLLVAIMSKKKK